MMYRSENTQHVQRSKKKQRWQRIVMVVLLFIVGSVFAIVVINKESTDGYTNIVESRDETNARMEAKHSLDNYIISSDEPLSSRKYHKIFNDNNDIQLAAARLNGISKPFSTRDDFVNLPQLMYINHCSLYYINELTHSLPYLVPSARVLLDDIGLLFRRKVKEKYVDADYRIIVTSLLRTEEDIRKLRRRNRNATEKSCHRYGTTFDIAYARFDKGEGRSVNETILKHILAETLYELRQQGRCFVIYERRQRCFHITVRKVDYKFTSVPDCIDMIHRYAMIERGNGHFQISAYHPDINVVSSHTTESKSSEIKKKVVIYDNYDTSSHVPFL